MRRSLGRVFVAGTLAWAGLTACSAALVGPRPASESIDLSGPPRSSGPPGAPLALVWDTTRGPEHLARIDPRTLEVRRKFELGRRRAARVTAFSPDAEQLMTVTWNGHVRVVDLKTMTDAARFRLETGFAHRVAWVEPDVAIVVTAGGRATEFVRFDPLSGDVLGTEKVAARAFAVKEVRGGVVALLYEWADGTEPRGTTIAAFDSEGDLHTALLDEVAAGYVPLKGYARELTPGLAVRGSTATVVGTGGEIATVDLESMSVEMAGSGSFFSDLSSWITPPAHAKTVAGTALEAEWIGPEALLVTGHHVDVEIEPDSSVTWRVEPAGASILEAGSWTPRMVDADATIAAAAGGLLVTAHDYVAGEADRGFGLRAFDEDGRLVWHALGSQILEIVGVEKDTVLVRHFAGRVRISAIDLRSGKVLTTKALLAAFPPGDDLPF